MNITIQDPESYVLLAQQAGFDSLEQYIRHLLEQDAERAAIKGGIRAMRDGEKQTLAEMRSKHQNQKDSRLAE